MGVFSIFFQYLVSFPEGKTQTGGLCMFVLGFVCVSEIVRARSPIYFLSTAEEFGLRVPTAKGHGLTSWQNGWEIDINKPPV